MTHADRIVPLTDADWAEYVALLTAAKLPLDGLAQHRDAALVLRQGGRVVAGAALECYGTAALVRSVVVAEGVRGGGIGARLVAALRDLARARGVTALYLLTIDADGFFARHGFRTITRADVPPEVHASLEFRGACPDTAIAMRGGV